MEYKVTLVQRTKVTIEASSPKEALEVALKNQTGENVLFVPNSWTIKEEE